MVKFRLASNPPLGKLLKLVAILSAEMSKAFPVLTEIEISKIETELDIKIPDDYKWFLMNEHAFKIETYEFVINDVKYDFGNFIPLSSTQAISLISFNKNMKQHFGNDFIVIAFDYASDVFLMSTRESDLGSIHYLRGDLEMEEGLVYLVDSFQTFCDILSEYTYKDIAD